MQEQWAALEPVKDLLPPTAPVSSDSNASTPRLPLLVMTGDEDPLFSPDYYEKHLAAPLQGLAAKVNVCLPCGRPVGRPACLSIPGSIYPTLARAHTHTTLTHRWTAHGCGCHMATTHCVGTAARSRHRPVLLECMHLAVWPMMCRLHTRIHTCVHSCPHVLMHSYAHIGGVTGGQVCASVRGFGGANRPVPRCTTPPLLAWYLCVGVSVSL